MKKLTLDLPVLLPGIPDTEDKCVARLLSLIEGREGVYRVHIKTDGESPALLCIHFNPDVISLRYIKNVARQTGSQLHDIFGHLLIQVHGIRHPRHARSITRRLGNLDGMIDAFAGATGWIRLEFNRSMVNEHTLLATLEEMGLPIEQLANGSQNDHAHTSPAKNASDTQADYELPAPEIDVEMHHINMDAAIESKKEAVPDQTEEKDKKELHEEEDHEYKEEESPEVQHQHEHHGKDEHDNDSHTHEEGESHDHDHDDGSHDHAHDHGGIFGEKTELIFSLICGGLLATGFGLSFIGTIPSMVPLVLYIGAYFFGSYYLVQEAYTEVKAGNFEIDFLMLVAAAGAAILGAWAESALLLFLFSLGHSLEHYAMGRARDAIKGLADLAPKTALKKIFANTKEVPVEKLQVDDVYCHQTQQ